MFLMLAYFCKIKTAVFAAAYELLPASSMPAVFVTRVRKNSRYAILNRGLPFPGAENYYQKDNNSRADG